MERGLSDSRIRLLFSSQQSIRLGQSGKRMHKTGKETEPVMGPVGQTLPGLAFPNMELEQNSSCTDLYRLFCCSSCKPVLWRHVLFNISKQRNNKYPAPNVKKVPFYLQNFILCFTSILLGVLLLSITFVNRQKLLRALYLLSILRRWSFVDFTSHYLSLHDIIQKNKRYKRMDKGGERGCAKRRAA